MVPKGRSFQSVIAMAPGARSEPLQGGANTGAVGYQIDGATNAENAYLVEGQETANIQTGASNTNVPMEFIQEVQIKSSGFEAEYGGALGAWSTSFRSAAATPGTAVSSSLRGRLFRCRSHATVRKNPDIGAIGAAGTSSHPSLTCTTAIRAEWTSRANYTPKKDHYRIFEPGFEVGGDLVKDRLWVFASTVPRLYVCRAP